MKEFTVGKNDAGQRLDRFVTKTVPLLPASLLQKYIRLKRIKVNGARAERDYRLQTGDVLQLYINDEFFDKPNEENLFLTAEEAAVIDSEIIMKLINSPLGQRLAEAEAEGYLIPSKTKS